jgi:geranyl-CoA carboxylase alpha subunit
VTRRVVAVLQQGELHMALGGSSFVFSEVSPFPGKDAVQDVRQARSPVAGKITQIKVAVGDAVLDGQPLLCVEAMKMEMWLAAQTAGTVTAVHAQVGDQVESGAVLVEIEPEAKKEES